MNPREPASAPPLAQETATAFYHQGHGGREGLVALTKYFVTFLTFVVQVVAVGCLGMRAGFVSV
jgi:hypothetical protein